MEPFLRRGGCLKASESKRREILLFVDELAALLDGLERAIEDYGRTGQSLEDGLLLAAVMMGVHAVWAPLDAYELRADPVFNRAGALILRTMRLVDPQGATVFEAQLIAVGPELATPRCWPGRRGAASCVPTGSVAFEEPEQ